MEPIQLEPIHAPPPPPPRKSSRVFHPPKRYLTIISEDVKEIFLTKNKVYRDDPKIYDEAISDIDFKK